MKHTKYILFSLRFFLLLAVPLLFSVSVWATISSYTPTTAAQLKSSYYTNLDGKSGSTLFSAVSTATGGVMHTYTKLTYAELYTAYHTSDVYPTGHANAGKIWDMYSTVLWTPGSKECGNYNVEGDCYNREHSLPKSWFGGSDNYKNTNQGCDLGHLVPTDGYVNSMRSNYAFGEVSSATYTSNGGLSKLGTSKSTISTTASTMAGTSVSASGTVFEPADEYKGDFARIYFYMRAHYPSLNLGQADGGTKHFSTTTAAASDSKFGLTNYSIVLLLKWHRQDPVSQKEIDRNNAMEKMQGNRNPFVDYPCLAEYLWGDKNGQTFNLSSVTGSFESGFVVGTSDGCSCATTDPTLSVSSSSITIDPIATSSSTTQTFTITGANLTGSISITKNSGSSSYITVSPTSITSGYNGTNIITITYNAPALAGTHTATLTISSTGATPVTVNITASCAASCTATWMAKGSQFDTSTTASGGRPDVPATNPSNCSSSRVFVGWTESSSVSSEPADLFTTTAPTITTNKTFYAVYADATTSGSGTTTYNLASSIAAGDQVVIACNTANTTAGALSSQVLGSVSSTFSSDKSTITSLGSGTLIFTVGGTSGAYTLSTSDGALGATAAKKLAFGSGTTTWSITISSGTATITNGTSSYGSMQYNSSSPRFTTYTSGQTAVQLYKVTAGSTTTYDNYSLSCSSGPTVTITFNANGGSGTMAAQTVPQSTNTTLSTNTFTRDGYSFAGWATSSGGSVVYTDGGTINTSSDITLYAKWTALPTITMTFMNNGVQHTTRSGYVGQTVSSAVPDPTACEGYTFEGWSTSTYAADNTDTPSWADISTIPATNTTYYAVFSKTEGTGSPVLTNNYKKITTTAELTDGNYIIASSTHALKNAVTSNGYYLQEGTVTISSDVITSTDASIIWQIQKSGTSNYTIYNSNVNKYVYVWTNVSGSKTYYELGLTTETKTFTAAYTSSKWQFKSTDYTSYMICYRGASYAYFNPYTSQSEALDLYKQQTEISSTTYHTTSPACSCTYTITATTDDSSQGTVSVTTP